MLKKILLPVVFLSGLALSAALSIGVSPAKYELTADKGKTVYGEFSITNESDTDQVYSTSVENFSAQGETGTPFFSKSDKDLASWTHVDSVVSVSKGEKKIVQFSVSVPDNTDAGFHGAAIFLYAKPPEGKDVSVSIGTKVGMLILLKVSGEIKVGGDIKEFSAYNPRDTNLKAKTTFTELPVLFSYRFTNSGSDRINPYGVISIKNTFGMSKDILSANPSQGNVLPQSIRKYDVTWGDGQKDTVPEGYFAKAFYQANHFAFGSYTANLKIAYDIGAKKDIIETNADIAKNIEKASLTAEKTLKIFVFPWQLLSLTLLSLTAFLVLFTKGLKRYNKWVIQQAKLSMKK